MAGEEFKSLPLIGAQLVRLRFCGNGKDAKVTIETAGNRTAVIPLSDARMRLMLSGSIPITCEGLGLTRSEVTSPHPVKTPPASRPSHSSLQTFPS